MPMIGHASLTPALPATPPSVPESTTAASAAAAALGSPSPKVLVKAQDMSEEMRRVAVELALVALSRYELERDMARFMKNEFDRRFQPTWQCIIGNRFGSYVTGEDGCFLYLNVGKLAILLFRAGHEAVA